MYKYFGECATLEEAKARRASHAALLHIIEPWKEWKQTDSNGQRSQWTGCNHRARADVYSAKISEIRIDNPTEEEVIKIFQIIGDPKK